MTRHAHFGMAVVARRDGCGMERLVLVVGIPRGRADTPRGKKLEAAMDTGAGESRLSFGDDAGRFGTRKSDREAIPSGAQS